jgi:hypothetical protein
MIRSRLFLLLLASASANADDILGTVCFGRNLAKPASEHSDRLYLRIDESEKLYFNHKYDGPVVRDLDPNVVHAVSVYFDDQLSESWRLDFNKLNTRCVLIWRAAGSWRMEPIEASECR